MITSRYTETSLQSNLLDRAALKPRDPPFMFAHNGVGRFEPFTDGFEHRIKAAIHVRLKLLNVSLGRHNFEIILGCHLLKQTLLRGIHLSLYKLL